MIGNDLPGLLGEDDEHASLLVEDPLELLVQDHLTQLLLHLKRKTISIKVQGCHEFSSDYPKHTNLNYNTTMTTMYLRLGKADFASHIVHLHLAVRLNDPEKVPIFY